MNPVTSSITIGRPREEVFAYLADIANHPEFTDHFLTDWHLTRENSFGRGAGARFRVQIPANRFDWADLTLSEVDEPHRIVERGRVGKYNRVPVVARYTLNPGDGDSTEVELTTETEPATLADRMVESLGARGWLKRKQSRALRRLRSILEDGEQRGRRATVAGR